MIISARNIFSADLPSIKYFLEKYPRRSLPASAIITRFAPSPTGYIHIGGIYIALISQRFANQTGGVYFLRIEDTDKVREIEGTNAVIAESLHKYGLDPDEGMCFCGGEKGAYGPYRQSERIQIYQSFIRYLMECGRAYPCFCTKEDLDVMREGQEKLQATTGYYGQWARCRNLPKAQVEEMLKSGKDFVIRLKSVGVGREFMFNDLLKGVIQLPENNKDAILMKSDGFPTYHLAHVIDDYLMGTTHVFRSDDWVSSIPLHCELFDAFGFSRPIYGHVPPITKIDANGGKRKLSKRKDPEANVLFYQEIGYPEEAVIEYLLNLANSDFENWRKLNPEKSHSEFVLDLKRFSNTSGPLFDEMKLRDISRVMIANINADEIFSRMLEWSKKHDISFHSVLRDNQDLWVNIFSIERGGAKKRKDICTWSDVKSQFTYVHNGSFTSPDWSEFHSVLSPAEIREVLDQFCRCYSATDSSEQWMKRIRVIAMSIGLAPDIKTFKKDKDKYRGHVGEVSQVVRYAITGKMQTPDLHQIMQFLGEDECKKRLTQNH